MHIKPKDLEAKFGDKAAHVWAELCKAAGFGSIPFSHTGGINVQESLLAKFSDAPKSGGKKAKAKTEPVQVEAPVITDEEPKGEFE